ncbi:MAG: dimethylmenaquinone methyltransferase [Bacteroidetes bacterium RBG_13_46_8]|nr:MAG: dimethylmenaquinone methyltransferase [Bacteroidetes bacterium RBG_13_46_8]
MGIIAQTSKPLTDEQLLELYKGLRVADVSDGMDMVGLRDAGILDQRIEALWKDTENFTHRICGIAVTARYVPTNKVVKNPMTSEEFRKWESDWYNTLSPEPWTDNIKPGSIVVLDVEGDGDTGSVGSANSLVYIKKGARGIVCSGGVRDIDEIILERIPVYLDWSQRGRGIRPGRNELESFNKPVTVGGVLIRPGDMIVADGDGVVCVPREYAEDVAAGAKRILDGDKNARKGLYLELGREPDKTVLP